MTKALIILLLVIATRANAATDVWLFYGWGPHGWSSGIDQIARRVRTLSGVNHVTVLDYRDTQRAYDEARQSPHEHSLAFVGYSCGGNAAIATCAAFASSGRACYVIALQPSRWCGQYATTHNMPVVQDTWSAGTFGLGDYQPPGDAHRTILIERPNPHGAADTDATYQRDAVFAVGAIADPSRRHWLANHLGWTTHFIGSNGRTVWLRE